MSTGNASPRLIPNSDGAPNTLLPPKCSPIRPTAENARRHISIGRDSSGADPLTCTSRPFTTRTNRACRAQDSSRLISGRSSLVRARTREKWSRSSASATARASPRSSRPSRVTARPARTHRVKPRRRASCHRGVGGREQLGGAGEQHRRQRPLHRLRGRGAVPAGDLGQRGAVDRQLAAVHAVQEQRRRRRGRAWARRGAASAPPRTCPGRGCARRPARRAGPGWSRRPGRAARWRWPSGCRASPGRPGSPMTACSAVGTASRSSSRRATVRGNHTASASATWARVQCPSRPSTECLWSSTAATSADSTSRPRRRAQPTTRSRSRSRAAA
jgi:hypothetical protein